ncbi:MAG: glycosyltransferase family 39 protein [Candidatus Caenarcaniphilales bacterium]|nr:glycosyltransferase family 39 protein [Candidatus Caenarcaniphilales bacterium]
MSKELWKNFDKNYLYLFFFLVGTRLFLLFLSYVAYAEFEKGDYWYSFLVGMINQLEKADVYWYMNIATEGYLQKPFTSEDYQNWAFYPLWPAILWLSNFTNLSMFSFGLIVCNLLFVASVALMYKLLKKSFSKEISFLSCILFLLFPYSYYFSRPGNESIFLFLTLLVFIFAQKKQWLWAGIFGALSTLARVQGLFIIFPILYLYWKDYRDTKKFNWSIASVTLIPLSLCGFMYHLYYQTGNFFASFEIQKAWHNGASYPFDAMFKYLHHPVIYAHSWELSITTFSFMLSSVILAVWLVLKNKKYKIPVEYLLLMGFHIFVNVARTNLMAGNRYLIVVFPLFIGLAIMLEKKPNLLAFAQFVFSATLCFFTVAIFNGRTWAMP